MTTPRMLASLAAFALLLGCQLRPPIDVRPSFVASPKLAEIQPIDIAVLPIQDATPGHAMEGLTEPLRQDIGFALADRAYSPLSSSHVDARVSEQQVAVGSAVDANFIKQLTGRCAEDAVLGIRVTRWDDRTMMTDARVRFSAEALLLANDGAVLWSGRADGSVKAGDDGPAPLAKNARARAAVAVLAKALMRELPRRR